MRRNASSMHRIHYQQVRMVDTSQNADISIAKSHPEQNPLKGMKQISMII